MWKWERREKRLNSKKAKMKIHGRHTGEQYRTAIMKEVDSGKEVQQDGVTDSIRKGEKDASL